jgi:hypothetical protein
LLKQNKAKQDLLLDREKEIKKKVQELDLKKSENVIAQTNQVALQAIQKEMNLEQMIKHEEDELEAREEKEIIFKIEEERKKGECLAMKIKEKALENQYNLKAIETEQEAKKIKEETAQQILVKRNQLNDMLKKQRDNAKKKRMKLKQKLLDVRLEMATEMSKANKKGEISKCQQSVQSKVDRQTYCSVNFAEDYASYTTCNEGNLDEFCTMCCDSEFGEFYQNDRNECYKKICAVVELKTSPFSQNNNQVLNPATNGKWVWQEVVSALVK